MFMDSAKKISFGSSLETILKVKFCKLCRMVAFIELYTCIPIFSNLDQIPRSQLHLEAETENCIYSSCYPIAQTWYVCYGHDHECVLLCVI